MPPVVEVVPFKNNCFPIQFGIWVTICKYVYHVQDTILKKKKNSHFGESNQEINPARPKPFLSEIFGCVDIIEALDPPPDFGAKLDKFCIFKFTKGPPKFLYFRKHWGIWSPDILSCEVWLLACDLGALRLRRNYFVMLIQTPL